MKQKEIKQSVINTLNRVGIPYESYDNTAKIFKSINRFSGESCDTTQLIYFLINWVYKISNDFEMGNMTVNLQDFDRIRYFILDQDQTAYTTCID